MLLLAHLLIIFGALGMLVLSALRVWRQVRATRAAVAELRERAVDLAERTSALSERLDAAAVSTRLAERA